MIFKKIKFYQKNENSEILKRWWELLNYKKKFEQKKNDYFISEIVKFRSIYLITKETFSSILFSFALSAHKIQTRKQTDLDFCDWHLFTFI